jgi:hypothetical protein
LVSKALDAQTDESLRPVADHHAHLQSLTAWGLFHETLPVVTPPADVDRVLRAFEHGGQSLDKSEIASLFTKDGMAAVGGRLGPRPAGDPHRAARQSRRPAIARSDGRDARLTRRRRWRIWLLSRHHVGRSRQIPDVPVQIAHLAGWGGYGPETDRALAVFADAIAAGDRRTTNLYFDISAVVSRGLSTDAKQLIVRRIRQIGVRRILFAVDGVEPPLAAWGNVMTLPLEPAELRTMAANLAPYFR